MDQLRGLIKYTARSTLTSMTALGGTAVVSAIQLVSAIVTMGVPLCCFSF